MVATRPSLKAFLATARKALASPPTQTPPPLTFVLGNESADLDSICSAVLLAYFRTHSPPHNLHIPLANLPRSNLTLRPELTAVLRPAGLNNDDLITLSDLPKNGALRSENTQWFLVDHNAPTGDLSAQFIPTTSIVGCIDHHEDEGKVPHEISQTKSAPRIIEKSGSCMSLVVDHCKETWQRLSTEDTTASSADLDTQISHLALGPILIDTTNLTSKDKTTTWDTSAVEFAESMIHTPTYNRTQCFDEITRLKEDIIGMSYRDIIRKDYKQWTESGLSLGTAVVTRGFGYLLEVIGDKNELFAAVQSWAGEQGLDMVALMTVSRPEGTFTRELLVCAFSARAVKVARQFVQDNEHELGLEKWRDGELDMTEEGNGEEWRMCWRQRGVESSRKQVAPMLREAIENASKL